MRYEYKAFVCRAADLQDTLNALGQTSWRLHTCEPVGLTAGEVTFAVVMDRATAESEEVEDRGPGVMEARG